MQSVWVPPAPSRAGTGEGIGAAILASASAFSFSSLAAFNWAVWIKESK